MASDKKERGALSPGLYLVATPVGNLGDITLRGLDVLKGASLIVCEDTRITGRLLKAYGIKAPRLLAYNDHNAGQRRPEILRSLDKGEVVAMVSDAGTPLVSDPGYKLVRECIDPGYPVTGVPGASAPLLALQLSGLPSDSFSFLGFLPPRRKGRQQALKQWAGTPGSLVIFESAPRLTAMLEDMVSVLGNRSAAIARELTKMYEEVRRGDLESLLAHYRESGPPKGEIAVVVGPAGEDSGEGAVNLEEELSGALQHMSVRDAAAFVAEKTGKPKKEVYGAALKMTGKK